MRSRPRLSALRRASCAHAMAFTNVSNPLVPPAHTTPLAHVLCQKPILPRGRVCCSDNHCVRFSPVHSLALCPTDATGSQDVQCFPRPPTPFAFGLPPREKSGEWCAGIPMDPYKN